LGDGRVCCGPGHEFLILEGVNIIVAKDTPRLLIRQATPADASFMLELLNEPAWRKFIRQHDVNSAPAALDYLEERIFPAYEEGMGFWLVAEKSSQLPIGICGLVKRPYLEQVDLGFGFLERAWGKGFAREAALSVIEYAESVLQLPELWAITVAENAQSITLLEKLSFSFSKTLSNPEGEALELYSLRLGVE
jgi:RimJ/RimL family protein N-acetyltransferase